MAKPYSVDLRRRVLEYIEETADKRNRQSCICSVGTAKFLGKYSAS